MIRKMVVSLDMCFYCFTVVSSHLSKKEIPKSNFLKEPYPLFVTWTIGKNEKLRGCIGTFDFVDLNNGLKEYAITSAFNDTRFDPISRKELPELHVSVSILTNFENGSDYLDWEIGKHGIKIEFINVDGRKYTATFLPEVPAKHGWSKTVTINCLLEKGGYRLPVTEEFRRSIKLIRYQSEKLTVSYQQYLNSLK